MSDNVTGNDVLDLERENARLERASPADRLAFAVSTWGDRLLLTSSFGAGSGVLLHLWSRIAPQLPVVFIDTGFLFEETLAYRDALALKLGLQIEVARPAKSREDFLWDNGADVMARDPDFCCAKNKIEPLRPYLSRARAWVSGLRRDQGETRGRVPILLATEGGLVKVHPLATMTAAEVQAYMRQHGIPEHPLKAKRYLSIGCEPCTTPVCQDEGERAGRWSGRGKTECGLHTLP